MVEYTRPFLYPKQREALFHNKRIGAVEASTKSGKTQGSIAWILERTFLGKPGQIRWWVAPVSEQARIAYTRIKSGLTTGTFTAYASPVPRIETINGGILAFKSGDQPDSLYGEDVEDAVVDEASRCKQESWEALLSTLTATHGSVRCIGNVKGKRNWFYQLCRRIENGLEPNGHYARITYLDAIAAGVITPESVEEERRNMSAATFRELFEAVARDDTGNPFGEDHIYACVRREGLSQKPPVAFGIDLAKHQDWFVVIGLDDEGNTCVFERWQGVPWRDSIRKVHSIVGEDVPTLVDSTGLGDPVLEELQHDHGNFRGFHFSQLSKQRLMEGLAVSIQGHEIGFPDGPIKGELLSFEYVEFPTGMRYAALEGESDDCVCALALAREQLTTVAPAANLMQFYGAEAARARRQVEADLVADDDSSYPLPEASERSARPSADQFDNELTELYRTTLAQYEPESRTCRRCNLAVLGPTRITDGRFIWHQGCA